MTKFSLFRRLQPVAFSCIKRTGFVILFSSVFLVAKSQEKQPEHFSKQLSFLSDNDFYLFQGKDGYYTNGFMLNYDEVHHSKRGSFLKQVDQFTFGQKMYTAYSRKIHSPDQIDRPITGYLFLQFSRSDFLKKNQMFQWGIAAGTIGKASLGETLQTAYHKLIHINTSEWGWVWDYQLKSAFGIDLHAKYAKALVQTENSFMQITPLSEVTLGMNFTNASEGVLLQLGKLKKQNESVYWNASLDEEENKNQSELFFYYYPKLTLQLYNATIQGGLLNKDKGPIVSYPEPFVLLQQVGAIYSFKRYSLRLGVNFSTKEAKSQRFNHKYGTFEVCYRFN
ncbi:MAG: lipid A-modifier LpxR family protein [Ginsengibacter sp.]